MANLQQELARAAVEVGTGAGKLLDANPNNNVEGITDVAQGVARAVRVTGQELDKHLKAAGIDLSQLSYPKGDLAPEKLLAEATKNGLKAAWEHMTDPEVQKREQEEAERKAREEAERKAREAESQKKAAEAEAKEAHSRRDTDKNENKRMKAWDETTVRSEHAHERDPKHYDDKHTQAQDGSYNDIRNQRQIGIQGLSVDNNIMGQFRSPEQIHQENEALRQHHEDSRPQLVKGESQQREQPKEEGRAEKEKRRRPQNYLV